MSRQEGLIALLALALITSGIMVEISTGATATAGGLIAAAPVIVILYQSVLTRKSVAAAARSARSAEEMLNEVRRDRELAWQPHLVMELLPSQGGRPDELKPPAVMGTELVIRNVGRGTAVQCFVARRPGGSGAELEILKAKGSTTLGAGDKAYLYAAARRTAGQLSPEPVACCLDQFGATFWFTDCDMQSWRRGT
jgi:hypothetical protein